MKTRNIYKYIFSSFGKRRKLKIVIFNILNIITWVFLVNITQNCAIHFICFDLIWFINSNAEECFLIKFFLRFILNLFIFRFQLNKLFIFIHLSHEAVYFYLLVYFIANPLLLVLIITTSSLFSLFLLILKCGKSL
jgi:hypothetical protein